MRKSEIQHPALRIKFRNPTPIGKISEIQHAVLISRFCIDVMPQRATEYNAVFRYITAIIALARLLVLVALVLALASLVTSLNANGTDDAIFSPQL